MFIKRLKSISSSVNPNPCFKLIVAYSLYSRLKGLMFRRQIQLDQAMLIKNCNWVHTFCMRFSIDVLYLDKDFKVAAVKRLKPFRLSMPVKGAVQVMEIQAGAAEYFGITVGDIFVTE
jgi:uncharacterized membrane protein (UPF0127 family)